MSLFGHQTPHLGNAVQWTVGGSVAVSGAVAQISDAASHNGFWSNTHVVFGLLLCLGVVCHFRFGVCGDHATRAQIRSSSRQLKSRVYVLLYALAAVKIMLSGRAADASTAGPESFQPYLAWGVAALLLARALRVNSSGLSKGAVTPSSLNA